MNNDSVITPDFDINVLRTQNKHIQMQNGSARTPYEGMLDKNGEVRLRLGVIDNHEIKRDEGTPLEPLNDSGILNMNTGKVTIRWIDQQGGIIRPAEFSYPNNGYSSPWQYLPELDTKIPENRTLNCYTHEQASDREMIELTHSLIWANNSNWCGLNYLPPIGSIVIVGFRKFNLPVILGYVQPNFKVCKPYLKIGEMMMKGYGNNYIHWRWSDKIDIHANSTKGNIDIDDPFKQDTYPHSSDLWMRFDCYKNNIIISASDETQNLSMIEIKPDRVYIRSVDQNLNGSNIVITPSKVDILSDGNINIGAKGSVNINGGTVNIN